MKIEVINSNSLRVLGKTNKAIVCISHDGQQREVELKEYKGEMFLPGNNIFEPFNEYMETLPMTTQQDVWTCVNDALNIAQDGGESGILIWSARGPVSQLFSLPGMNPDDVYPWLKRHPDYPPPSELKEDYVVDDMRPGSRDQTYTKEDWRRLVCAAILLRVMVPIWSEVISVIRREVSNRYKNSTAYRLLSGTSVASSAAVDKLQKYIAANFKPGRSMLPNMLDGLSSEDYLDWVLTGVMIERICVGDLRSRQDEPDLVVRVYKYINQLVSDDKRNLSSQVRFGGPVAEKSFASLGRDQDPSRFEGYKCHEPHPIGHIVRYEVFLTNYYQNLAKQLAPDLSAEFVDELVEHNKRVFSTEMIGNPQMVLMKWVLSTVHQDPDDGMLHHAVEHRMLDEVAEDAAIYGLSVAQAVLLHSGHHQVAVLLSAVPVASNDQMKFAGLNSSTRISKEQTARLAELYPYQRIPAQKPKTAVQNDAVAAINAVTQMLQMETWKNTLPEHISSKLMGLSTTSVRFPCPPDIKLKLADVAIAVATSNWTKCPNCNF